MKIFFKLLIVLFVGGTLVFFFVISYLAYTANKNDPIIIANQKLNSFEIKDDYKGFNKKVTEKKKDFILKVLIRGLPQLIKYQKKCINDINLELATRGMDINDISIAELRGLDIIKIIRWHTNRFSANAGRIIRELDSIIFPVLENSKVSLKYDYTHDISDSIFYEVVKTYVDHARCIPNEYFWQIEKNLDLMAYSDKKSVYFTPLPSLFNDFQVAIFFPSLIYNLMSVEHSRNIRVMKLSLLDKAKDLENLIFSNINKKSFIKILLLRNQIKYELNSIRMKEELDNKKMKRPVTDDGGDKKSFFVKIYEDYKILPKDVKSEYILGAKLFFKDLSLSVDELEAQAMVLDTEGLEYKVKKEAIIIQEMSDLLIKSILEKLKIEDDDTEEMVISKISYIFQNFNEFIDKNEVNHTDTSVDKKSKIKKSEEKKLKYFLDKMNKIDNI